MALEIPGINIGIVEAAVDLSAAQYKCVKITAALTINLCTAAGEAFVGVLQNKPKAGEAANIMTSGVTKVKAGSGGLAAGNSWVTAADGTAIAASASQAGAGMVLQAATEGNLATVTIGCQNSGTISNAVSGTAAGKKMNAGSHTVTAGEAAANTLSIAHGLTTVESFMVQVLDTGNNVVTSDADVTVSGANIIVADGSTYNTVENYIVKWFAFGT